MGFAVIPGSRNVEHIRDNLDILDFTLTGDEMAEIARLNKGKRYYTRTAEALAGFAGWMKFNSRAIYGCGSAPGLTAPDGCRYTYNAKTNRLYVHIKAWPFEYLHLPELAGKIRYAQFLGDGSEVKFTEDAWTCGKKATPENSVTLRLPVLQPRTPVPVVELFLK